MINAQNFTKTSAAWGIDNNKKGTNTNRIVNRQVNHSLDNMRVLRSGLKRD